MKIKPEALSNESLHWAVATCLGGKYSEAEQMWIWPSATAGDAPRFSKGLPDYSTDHSVTGPILDGLNISAIRCSKQHGAPDEWAAEIGISAPRDSTEHQQHDPMYAFAADELVYGPTRLVAGLRCWVRHELGRLVDVPDSIARQSVAPEARPDYTDAAEPVRPRAR